MGAVAMIALRAIFVLIWLCIGFCIFGVSMIRPSDIAVLGFCVTLGAIWILMPFALYKMTIEITQP